MRTQKRWMRVDLALYANPPDGSTTPIPDLQILAGWTNALHQKLGALISDVEERAGQIVAISGGVNELEDPNAVPGRGRVNLSGFSISSFRLVQIPRLWHDPQRRDLEKASPRNSPDLPTVSGMPMTSGTTSVPTSQLDPTSTPPPKGAARPNLGSRTKAKTLGQK